MKLIATLSDLLSTSPYHSTLSLLPSPTPSEPNSSTTQYVQTILQDELPVLEEIVELIEKEDEAARSKEVEKRRTRLGGKPQTKAQLEESIFAETAVDSLLPGLYQRMLNHPSLGAELYRKVENKLFSFHLALLQALPVTDDLKAKERKEVRELAKGAVLVGSEDREAWEVDLEWADWEKIGLFFVPQECLNSFRLLSLIFVIDQYPASNFKKYISLFPDSHLALFMRGYLKYFGLEDAPEPEETDSGKGKKGKKNKKRQEEGEGENEVVAVEETDEDPYKLMFVSELFFLCRSWGCKLSSLCISGFVRTESTDPRNPLSADESSPKSSFSTESINPPSPRHSKDSP